MPTQPIQLTPFAPAHLDGAVTLSRQAEWPHRLEDWRVSLALSQGVVAVENGNKVVGTVLVTPFAPDTATVNMVIVDAARRGLGLGRRLMEAALAIGGERALRLVATQDGLALYRKLGFSECGEIQRFQGRAAGGAATPGVDSAEHSDFTEIIRLDAIAFGAERAGLIGAIARDGRFVVLRRGGEITGFAALRPFGLGEVIGPVAAPAAEDAKAVISALVAERRGAFLRIDIPGARGLGDWLAEHGLSRSGGGIAMRRPPSPERPLPPVSTFALASQAFG